MLEVALAACALAVAVVMAAMLAGVVAASAVVMLVALCGIGGWCLEGRRSVEGGSNDG